MADSSRSSRYVYDIISTPETVRLLRLDLKRNGTISGHLITTKLGDAPPYFALSYCWGRHKKDVGILCDGKKLKVTASLAQALERLQALSGATQNWDLSAKWFWIDQICINQLDKDERSNQVQLMIQIYSKSIRTLIWLDTPAKSCDQAWALIDQIYDAFRKENPDAVFLSDIDVRLYSASYHKTCGLPDGDDVIWGHFRRLLEAPWFQRIWVVQEVAVSSQDPLVLHGTHIYSWERLAWASSWLRRVGFNRVDFVSQRILSIDLIANLRRSRVRWKLPALLVATSLKFDATDPRDKVFSLLGLAAETEDSLLWPVALLPDYRRNVAQVYRDVARFLINIYQNLAMFTRAMPELNRRIWRPWLRSDHSIDSWVPKWHVLIEANQTKSLSWLSYARDGGATELGFPSHYLTARGLPAAVCLTSDPKSLKLRGLRVDSVTSISRVGDAFTLPSLDDAPLSQAFNFLTSIRRSKEIFGPMDLPILLLTAWQKPLLLQSLAMTLEQCPGTARLELIDALITSTTANSFQLAGSDPAQIRKNGYAFVRSQIEKELERRSFWPTGIGARVKYRYLELLQGGAVGGKPEGYTALAKNFCINRRFFVTAKGCLGIGPKWTKKGDLVCVLLGGAVPYILRPAGMDFALVGESYVHGLMEGEAVDAWRKGRLSLETFSLT